MAQQAIYIQMFSYLTKRIRGGRSLNDGIGNIRN